jgi:dolichyldiphosphatase
MKPFSLTYVRYPEDDPLGLPMAIASLAPFCMIWTTVGAFMARRELWDVLNLLGILANEVLAQALKRHFKEPRPATCELVDFCDTHGMPSSPRS